MWIPEPILLLVRPPGAGLLLPTKSVPGTPNFRGFKLCEKNTLQMRCEELRGLMVAAAYIAHLCRCFMWPERNVMAPPAGKLYNEENDVALEL